MLAVLLPSLCPHDEALFCDSGMLSTFLPTDPKSPAAKGPLFLSWLDELMKYCLAKREDAGCLCLPTGVCLLMPPALLAILMLASPAVLSQRLGLVRVLQRQLGSRMDLSLCAPGQI